MIERVSRKTKRGRIRIFSLSLINNQNLVSLKNPPSIEFNTSISVSFRVRVPSFQFILINIQKNQTNATSSRLIFGYQFCFFYTFFCCLLVSVDVGRETKQSKSYYRQWREKSEKNIFRKYSLENWITFWMSVCVLVSRIQVIHCDDSKCTKRAQKISATKGKLNFPCVLF